MKDMPTTTVDLSWIGDLSFSSTDSSGHEIVVGAPEESSEGFEGFKPGEMMLTSLAGCSGIAVVGILRKQRQNITGITIKVTGIQEPEAPWTWVKAHLEYVVMGRDLDPNRVQRAIELSEQKYCSIGATLAARCKVSSTFNIVEVPKES